MVEKAGRGLFVGCLGVIMTRKHEQLEATKCMNVFAM